VSELRYSNVISNYLDETLTSYFLRLSAQLLIAPLDLRKELALFTLLGSNQCYYIDLDWPHKLDLSILAKSLGKKSNALYDLIMWRLASRLSIPNYDQKYSPRKDTYRFWFFHPFTKFCPECLKENLYYRLSWKLSPVSVCDKHRNFLLDYCTECGNKISLYKLSKKKSRLDNIDGLSEMVFCPNCRSDLRMQKNNQVPSEWLAANRFLINKLWVNSRKRDKGLLQLNGPSFFQNFYHLYRIVKKANAISQCDHSNSCNLNEKNNNTYVTYLTIKTMRDWPGSFIKPLEVLRGNNLLNIVGINERYDYEVTPEIREVYNRFTKRYKSLFLFHEATDSDKETETKKLSDLQWLRVLHFLMETKGFITLTLDLKGVSHNAWGKVMFPSGYSLRRAVEGIYYRLQTGIAFPELPEEICSRWEVQRLLAALGSKDIERLIIFLRKLMDEDDIEPGKYNALLNDANDAAQGITDYAWIMLRKFVPYGKVRGKVKLKGKNRTSPRKLAENMVKRLVQRPEARELCTRDDTQIAHWKSEGINNLNGFVRSVLEMANQLVDFEPSIRGDIITDEIWNEINTVEGLRIDKISNVPLGVNRKLLEIVVQSMYYEEKMISKSIYENINPGYCVETVRHWVKSYFYSGLLPIIEKELLLGSSNINKRVFEESMKDIEVVLEDSNYHR